MARLCFGVTGTSARGFVTTVCIATARVERTDLLVFLNAYYIYDIYIYIHII